MANGHLGHPGHLVPHLKESEEQSQEPGNATIQNHRLMEAKTALEIQVRVRHVLIKVFWN